MRAVVNVVVTCTKRKTHPPAARLHLRAVEAQTPEVRAERWIERLQAAGAERMRAEDLYAGDHWSVVRSMGSAVGDRVDLRLWICSAGYGLIGADAPVAAYSATFSAGHPDSVTSYFPDLSPRDTIQRWWQRLTAWSGPVQNSPRTLQELARRDPFAPLLIAGSPTYLQAITRDISNAATGLADPELLTVFSAGGRDLAGLRQYLVPFDARLRGRVGGGLMSLNVRIIREVLSHGWLLRRQEIARELGRYGSGLDPFTSPERVRQTDEQVRGFIRAELQRNRAAKWSPVHRQLRSQGLACEQKRFKRLFHEVSAEALTEAN